MNDSQIATSRRADTCVIVFALILPTLVTLLYFVLFARWPTAVQQTAYGTGKCIQFGLPLLWVFLVQRQRLRLKPPSRAGLPENVAFGLAALGAMFLLYHLWLKPVGYLDASSPAATAIFQKVEGLGLDRVWKYVALGAFYSLVHSGLEEYYWRWFVFGQLRRLVSLNVAIAVSSVGFMLHHIILLGTFFGYGSIATVLFSFCVAVGGAVWAWFYHRSGSLYGPWLGHLLVDVAIFIVGYDLVAHLFQS